MVTTIFVAAVLTCQQEPDIAVKLESLSNLAPAHGAVFSWEPPAGPVDHYVLYFFKAADKSIQGPGRHCKPNQAVAKHRLSGSVRAAWDNNRCERSYNFAGLVAFDPQGKAQPVTKLGVTADTYAESLTHVFPLFSPPEGRVPTRCLYPEPNIGMYFSWETPAFGIDHYIIYFFPFTGDQPMDPQKAIQSVSFAGSAKAAWDNRRKIDYGGVAVIAFDKDGRGLSVTELTGKPESKAAKPEGAATLFEEKGAAPEALAKTALAELLGDFGKIETKTTETLTKSRTEEMASHKLTYEQQVELIEKVFVPVFLKHKKEMMASLKLNDLTPSTLYRDHRVRAHFIRHIAEDFPSLSKTDRHEAILKVAGQVGGIHRFLRYDGPSKGVRPWPYVEPNQWQREQHSNEYFICSVIYQAPDVLSISEGDVAMAILEMIPNDSPIAERAKGEHLRLTHAKQYAQAMEVTKRLDAFPNKELEAIQILEKIPQNAHNAADARGLIAKLKKQHEEQLERVRKSEEEARKYAEEMEKRRKAFLATLGPGQRQIWDRYGGPDEDMPDANGKKVWIYKKPVYSNIDLIIGYEYREFVFDAKGELLSSRRYTQ
ncbi:MAG: hypothetical protein HYY16_08940 [Planctomycetes bacterium]|nr:hypothetical protein [Planctomycetota bacterium]